MNDSSTDRSIAHGGNFQFAMRYTLLLTIVLCTIGQPKQLSPVRPEPIVEPTQISPVIMRKIKWDAKWDFSRSLKASIEIGNLIARAKIPCQSNLKDVLRNTELESLSLGG